GVRGALAADGARGYDEVTHTDPWLGAAAGSDPQKRVHSELAQLLYGNGHRWAPDAAGARRGPCAVDPTGAGAELARPRLRLCVFEVPRDQLGAKWVARDQNVMTDLTGSQADVVLAVLGDVLHSGRIVGGDAATAVSSGDDPTAAAGLSALLPGVRSSAPGTARSRANAQHAGSLLPPRPRPA